MGAADGVLQICSEELAFAGTPAHPLPRHHYVIAHSPWSTSKKAHPLPRHHHQVIGSEARALLGAVTVEELDRAALQKQTHSFPSLLSSTQSVIPQIVVAVSTDIAGQKHRCCNESQQHVTGQGHRCCFDREQSPAGQKHDAVLKLNLSLGNSMDAEVAENSLLQGRSIDAVMTENNLCSML
eukprot:1157299-Pelagomonas_calceolata.AAC.1